MTNRLSTATLVARSAAFALAQRNPRLSSFRQRRGGVMRALKPASLLLAAAALFVLLAADITSAPNAEAQDATITSLLSRLDAELDELVITTPLGGTNHTQVVGYDAAQSRGSLSPAGFNYPAGFGPWYTVEEIDAIQEGASNNIASTGLRTICARPRNFRCGFGR